MPDDGRSCLRCAATTRGFADRLPIRRIILSGCTLAALALVLTSMAPSLILAGLSFVLFALGMTLYGPVVINSLMVKLYAGNEGKALALVAAAALEAEGSPNKVRKF